MILSYLSLYLKSDIVCTSVVAEVLWGNVGCMIQQCDPRNSNLSKLVLYFLPKCVVTSTTSFLCFLDSHHLIPILSFSYAYAFGSLGVTA